MRRHLVAFGLALALGLGLGGCGGGGGGGGSDDGGGGGGGTTGAKWTYMVYLGGDNNLSTAGLVDVNEMESAGSDANLNIVLQAEFSTRYTDFSGADYHGETLRVRVTRDSDPQGPSLDGATSIGNVDMGSRNTLTNFIRWAAQTYPADHYALVIWDHGAGWKTTGRALRGAVQDETSGSFMSLPDLAQAVADAGVAFDVINFDACLMAMYEVAYEFAGLTQYMTFSEETEPGDGDPYDTILGDLKANPNMGAAQLAATIVNRYIASYTGARAEKVTKSAVDMSRVAAVDTAVRGLSTAIVADWATVSGAVLGAQTNAQAYEYPTNLDLYDFASRLDATLPAGSTKTAAQGVMAAVANAVTTNGKNGAEVANSHGLAIYAPRANQVSTDQMLNDLQEYALLKSSATRANGWLDAVQRMAGGNADQVLQPGGFAFYVEWDTDADVDLWVCEPDGLCYSPWTGQTSPNGFFSGDSYDTGESVEYYAANDYVQSGDYDVFLEYYDNGPTSNYANVTFWYSLPWEGGGEWQNAGTFQLDLSNWGDYDLIPTYEDLNLYSNFWYVGPVTRAVPMAGGVRINSGERSLRVTVKHHKKRGGATPGKAR